MEGGRRVYRQVARAEASDDLRARILRAFMDALLAKWLDEITLDAVAAAAKTTRRTVIRFFGGKSGLIEAAIQVIPDEIAARRRQPPGTSLDAIAAATVADLEVLGDFYLRMLAAAPRNPEINPAIAVGRRNHRLWLAEALSPWLSGMPPDQAERALCESLIATDTYTWTLLRRDFGKSVAETEAIIAAMLRKALSETTG